jgi:integrase/recombinase XerD
MGLLDLGTVKPPHVAAYIEMLGLPEPEGQALSKPSVKQHLAALRMLFDWLVVGHVLDVNPAHAVRGPKYSQKKGKTPVLDREEARALLAVIDTGSLTGLRDRAFIGVMIYTFARVSAVVQLNVSDYFSQGRRGWLRFHEKCGKVSEAPCIPKLEHYLDEYIAAAGIAADKDGPLFRTTGRSTGTPHRMTQQDGYRLIGRYAKRAGIKTRIGNHSLRATGITDYLKSDGSLSEARKMANHADTRTTQLYDRRADETQAPIDITYHYPPELLELLCDAVPAMFRSKPGVIDFFVGAGVPNKLLGDWKLKLQQDKDSVRKHEIARSVLCRLNDAGEPALTIRREVLKRVSEFEDFSSCWDNDRLKATGAGGTDSKAGERQGPFHPHESGAGKGT